VIDTSPKPNVDIIDLADIIYDSTVDLK
jgi:hypothetical protein